MAQQDDDWKFVKDPYVGRIVCGWRGCEEYSSLETYSLRTGLELNLNLDTFPGESSQPDSREARHSPNIWNSF
jgi:hypothetical protein